MTLNSKENNDASNIEKKMDLAEKERLEKREKERLQAIQDVRLTLISHSHS